MGFLGCIYALTYYYQIFQQRNQMNGYTYQAEVANSNNQWPYTEAKNYQNWDSIFETYPHLKNINSPDDLEKGPKVHGMVIRSANDDNVHKGIKYGIWTTTPKNKNKIEQLWQRKLSQNTNTYLFFSAVKSGMFEGVARLKSGYHQQTFPFWWQNHTLKFKGYFEIEWVYIKDVNNKYFTGLYNTDGQEVIKSKDCDTLDGQTTLKMLNVFNSKKNKRHIFNDFAFMDQRQSQYIRKMYQMTSYYNQFNMMGYNGHRFDPSQLNMVGTPLNMVSANSVPPNNIQNPVMTPPPAMMRPTNNEQPGSNLGFQMNPVSKTNKKK